MRKGVEPINSQQILLNVIYSIKLFYFAFQMNSLILLLNFTISQTNFLNLFIYLSLLPVSLSTKKKQ